MPAVNNVLVVGAGLAGTATAIGLAAAGIAVDLIEVKPEVGAAGSGITMQGNGIRSATRRMIGITDEPRPAGLGAFRAFGPRPASVTRTDLIYGGPSYIAGYCPTSEDTADDQAHGGSHAICQLQPRRRSGAGRRGQRRGDTPPATERGRA